MSNRVPTSPFDWPGTPRERLHLATDRIPNGDKACIPYAICHAGITGFVRRTLRLAKFLRAKDRCRTCYRIYRSRLQ